MTTSDYEERLVAHLVDRLPWPIVPGAMFGFEVGIRLAVAHPEYARAAVEGFYATAQGEDVAKTIMQSVPIEIRG